MYQCHVIDKIVIDEIYSSFSFKDKEKKAN